MAIGISKTFPMDLELISRLMQFYGGNPGAKPDRVGQAIGLNRPKVDGLNKLMGYLGLQQGRRLTALGKVVLEHDRYLADLGTLCVFHYLLCMNRNAEVWYFASNRFIPHNKQFTRNEFAGAIDEANIGHGNTRLKADLSLFLNAYTSDEYHALQSTRYLSKVTDDRYRGMAVERIPALILGFALYDRRAAGTQSHTISINNLLNLDGQIGRIFLLERALLMEKLKQLEANGILGITQVADLDNVTFTHIGDPLSILRDYYQGRS